MSTSHTVYIEEGEGEMVIRAISRTELVVEIEEITINSIRVAGWARAELLTGCQWRVSGGTFRRHGALFPSEVTPSVQKKLHTLIANICTHYASARPLDLVISEISTMQNRKERVGADLSKLERELLAKREEMASISANIDELQRIASTS